MQNHGRAVNGYSNRLAEQAVLSALMRDNARIKDVSSIVGIDDFAAYPHRVAYQAILDLWKASEPADLVTLLHMLHERGQLMDMPATYLAELLDAAPAPCRATYYAGLVQEQSQRRQFRHICMELAGRTENGEPIDELLADVQKRVGALVARSKTNCELQPTVCSQLSAHSPDNWLWNQFIAQGDVVLLTALWKCGKSTLLAYLLRALAKGTDFCGQVCKPGNVLVISEENEGRWARRRDEIGLADNVTFICRPFKAKPSPAAWHKFINDLRGLIRQSDIGLVVLDSLSNLWPVQDENAAGEVQAALMPLHELADPAALLLMHHPRKSDGREGTASRGSGTLPAFVDTILELRRHDPSNSESRKRVLTGYSRWDDTPSELIIELDPIARTYSALGDREQERIEQIQGIIGELLPSEPPGLKNDEIRKNWPGTAPRKNILLSALNAGCNDGLWKREGAGVRNSPHTYWAK